MNHWLVKIEALEPGDHCETQAIDGQWIAGRVLHKPEPDLSDLWVIEVNGDRWHRYIEQIRCVGQTSAWPLSTGS